MKKNILLLLAAGSLAVFVPAGLVVGGLISRNQNYKQARTAYYSGDCDVAIDKFTKVLNLDSFSLFDDLDKLSSRSKQYKTECLTFMEFERTAESYLAADNPRQAWETYIDFGNKMEESPLVKVSQESSIQIFTEYPTETLAGSKTCNELDFLKTSNNSSDVNRNLPYFYFYCIGLLEQNGKLQEVSTKSLDFLEEYPNHSLNTDMMLSIFRSNRACQNLDDLQDNSQLDKIPRFLTILHLVCGVAFQETLNLDEAEINYTLAKSRSTNDPKLKEIAELGLKDVDVEYKSVASELSIAADSLDKRIQLCSATIFSPATILKDMWEFVRGRDCFTGKQLGAFNRLLTIVPIVGDFTQVQSLKSLFEVYGIVDFALASSEGESARASVAKGKIRELFSDADLREILVVNNPKLDGYVDRFLADLDTLKYLDFVENSLLNNSQNIEKPIIGVNISSLTPRSAKENYKNLNSSVILPKKYGALVINVLAEHPAEQAGLRSGDVIVSVNDAPIVSHYQFITIINNSKIGDSFEIIYLRNNEVFEVSIKTVASGNEITKNKNDGNSTTSTFPKDSCGDQLPSDSSMYPVTFYPVLINNVQNNLENVHTKFCQDAFVSTEKVNGQEMIQIASFSSLERAKAFQSFLKESFSTVIIGTEKVFPKAP